MGKNYEKFQSLNAEVVACSTDSHFSHLAWRSQHPSLRNLPFPMLSDFKGENAKRYEVYQESTGVALRGLYIIDPEGTLMYATVHPDNVGRNSQETLRVLQALQTGKKTACNWEAGEDTLN